MNHGGYHVPRRFLVNCSYEPLWAQGTIVKQRTNAGWINQLTSAMRWTTQQESWNTPAGSSMFISCWDQPASTTHRTYYNGLLAVRIFQQLCNACSFCSFNNTFSESEYPKKTMHITMLLEYYTSRLTASYKQFLFNPPKSFKINTNQSKSSMSIKINQNWKNRSKSMNISWHH